jgi:hypothetical protein
VAIGGSRIEVAKEDSPLKIFELLLGDELVSPKGKSDGAVLLGQVYSPGHYTTYPSVGLGNV